MQIRDAKSDEYHECLVEDWGVLSTWDASYVLIAADDAPCFIVGRVEGRCHVRFRAPGTREQVRDHQMLEVSKVSTIQIPALMNGQHGGYVNLERLKTYQRLPEEYVVYR